MEECKVGGLRRQSKGDDEDYFLLLWCVQLRGLICFLEGFTGFQVFPHLAEFLTDASFEVCGNFCFVAEDAWDNRDDKFQFALGVELGHFFLLLLPFDALWRSGGHGVHEAGDVLLDVEEKHLVMGFLCGNGGKLCENLLLVSFEELK